MFLLTLSYPISAKIYTFESISGKLLSRNALKSIGFSSEGYEQVLKKYHAIAPAALGGCGGLGQLWEALAELGEALGELWEGLEELRETLCVYIERETNYI